MCPPRGGGVMIAWCNFWAGCSSECNDIWRCVSLSPFRSSIFILPYAGSARKYDSLFAVGAQGAYSEKGQDGSRMPLESYDLGSSVTMFSIQSVQHTLHGGPKRFARKVALAIALLSNYWNRQDSWELQCKYNRNCAQKHSSTSLKAGVCTSWNWNEFE